LLICFSLKIWQDYEIIESDILKIGRVKFAVKEIGYSETNVAMQDSPEAKKVEKGHSSNSTFTDSKDEDFEEFTEVPAIMN